MALLHTGCSGCADADDDEYDRYCDDDDDDDKITAGGPLYSPPPEAFELREFGVVLNEDPTAHPIRRVTDIDGASLVAGLEIATTEDLLGFSHRIMEKNADLLSLPPEAGFLRFEGLIHEGCRTGVRFVQVGAQFDLPEGAGMLFVYDPDGSLAEIDNTTVIAVSAPAE